MRVLAAVSAVAMSALLLWAAGEKARQPRRFTRTIERLGWPLPLATAVAVTSAEFVLGVALIFRPDSAATQVGVLALAAIFALAGLWALGRDEPIHCSCFGGGGEGVLGGRQIVSLVPWMAGVGILYLGAGEPISTAGGAVLLAGVALALASARTVALVRAGLQARGDRRSAQEMYSWLPSR